MTDWVALSEDYHAWVAADQLALLRKYDGTLFELTPTEVLALRKLLSEITPCQPTTEQTARSIKEEA